MIAAQWISNFQNHVSSSLKFSSLKKLSSPGVDWDVSFGIVWMDVVNYLLFYIFLKSKQCWLTRVNSRRHFSSCEQWLHTQPANVKVAFSVPQTYGNKNSRPRMTDLNKKSRFIEKSFSGEFALLKKNKGSQWKSPDLVEIWLLSKIKWTGNFIHGKAKRLPQ